MQDTLKLRDSRVKMIAHRGVSGLERENTAAAFVAAGNRSYWGIETDVHRTADGAYVIIHDDDTHRVADVDMPVEGSTLTQLQALTLRDMDGLPRRDLVLPLLPEYSRICRKYGKVSVLELKNHFSPEQVSEIVAIVRKAGWLRETVFISFDLENLISLRRLLPDQPAQYLVCRETPDLLDTLTRYCLDLDMDYTALTPDLVQRVHAAGHLVNVWTVNELDDARRLADWGVDYITSNIIE
ncbi:MAG: glycerophosphodiester phosphodiesterase family protein [Eubacteriales bacterium]|nr:glycerophosphodiester phosphodiesterase family protein [Eubacteriales bacterium]